MPVGEQARRVLRLAESTPADEMMDRLEYLGAWG
jgi:hypothetical protein